MSTPVWKGDLIVGPLTITIGVISGPRPSGSDLHKMHKCGRRIRWEAHCDCSAKGAVPFSEVSLGREVKGKFVAIESDSSVPMKAITIDRFLAPHDFDPIALESSYFLLPGDDGEPAFAALISVMRSQDWFGYCSSVQLKSRKRNAVIRAGRSGLILHTLYDADEMRSLSEFRTDLSLAPRYQISQILAIGAKKIASKGKAAR